jgi:hypothetical protein
VTARPLALPVALTLLCSASACQASPRALAADDPASPLSLESKITLPNVAGRIDHLAIDQHRRLLFVAEYVNGTVDVLDLAAGKVVGRIAGLHQPQGVAVLRDGDVAVACGDGSVHFYSATDRHEIAKIDLGEDADNLRVDRRSGHLVVGYGSGGLAVIDPGTHRVISSTSLSGHPEGYALVGSEAVVNVPDEGSIALVNIDASKMVASWSTGLHRLNFPLEIDPTGKWAALAYRLPAALQIRDLGNGSIISTHTTCGDADGLFIARDRILVVCGSGQVEVASATDPQADPVRVTTAPGSRTGLFVPELHTLFVAVPARAGEAAIWVMKIKDGTPS